MLLSLGFAHALKAQITDVYAGNDTIELRVGNYQYGFVQWQTALDTANWTDIEGAIDTVYRFLPTKNGYYRARATFPNCPEEYSAVCYVLVPPKVDAGPDRNLALGDGATMFALLEDGCVGEWEIIEGEGGVLSDLHSKNAYFEGTEGEYKLKWTVTNACGSASDTLTIKYFHTVMNDNYLVVDTTDFILSDSTQLLNGEYIIAFSEPVTVNDSMLLVGMGEKSFLRKVISYSYDSENGFYIFETSQGTIADFLIEGVFSFDFASVFSQNRKVIVSNRFPTRKDIAELGWDGVFIRQPKADENTVRWCVDIGNPKLNWTPFEAIKLPYDFAILPSFTMDEPNFMCELKKSGWHVESFKFGLYNTAYMKSYQVYFPGKTSFSLKKKLPVMPKLPLPTPPIIIGPVEITLELSCDLNLNLTYTLGPEMSYYVVEQGFVCNYIMYDDVNGWRANSGRINRQYDFDADWPEYGDLTVKASLDLKLSFLFYSFLGPYVGFSLGFEGTHNTFGAGFTAEQFKIKEEYKLGAKIEVFGYDLLSFEWPFVTFDMLNYQDPYSIHYHSGNNQYYTPGQQLAQPLSVLVKNSRGRPSKGVGVKFETGGTSHLYYTNNQGLASVNWIVGSNATGTIQARAYSYNVKNEPVQGAPVVFNATSITPGGGGGGGGGGSWGDPDCTTLSVTAVYNNGVLKPNASGGKRPWLYSTDGVSYGSQPTIIPVEGQTYHFFVKDNNQCVADCYYTHPTQDCNSSTLSLRLSAQGNTVTAHASGGQSPYQYALDDEPYGDAYVFPNLMNGDHVVNVRDHNGCVEVETIDLDAYGGGGGGGTMGAVTVTTSPTVNVYDATSAHGSGSVSITGNATVSIVGLCWSRHHAPTTSDEYVQNAYSGNTFGNLMINLTPDVMYYLRAYAVTNTGTVYGNEVGFSTTAVAPVVTCGGVGNTTSTSVRALGNVSNINGTTVTERGFCWSRSHNPTISGSHLACGAGTGVYSGNITGLKPDTPYYLRAYATNSVDTSYSDEVSFRTFEGGGSIGDHDYVDLGLPSGTLWATCNVGANAPEEYGDYFAWGETQPKDYYDWSTYQYCNGSDSTLTKYCTNPEYGYNGFIDNLTILQPDDDVATVNWGDEWSMPTFEQFKELYQNTSCTWTTQNGVNGQLFTATNGASLFLPAAGNLEGDSLFAVGSFGNYWLNSLDPDDPNLARYYCLWWSAIYYLRVSDRCYGYSVRPVRSNSGPTSEVPEGAINGLFSVGVDTGSNGYSIRKVYFSQGNLQYIGSAATPYWKFAENQWDVLGDNGQGNSGQNIDRDLFGWGTSGWNNGNIYYQPWDTEWGNYFSNGQGYGPTDGTNYSFSLTGSYANADWGVYNSISNGGNQPNQWRTMTKEEWEYVFFTRSTASGIRFAKALVNGMKGVILLPDDWSTSFYSLNNTNISDAVCSSNTLTASQWNLLEQHGAVFLPAAGERYSILGTIDLFGIGGNYWSSSCDNCAYAYYVYFYDSGVGHTEIYPPQNCVRIYGFSIRLVQDAPNGSGSGNGGGGGGPH